MQSWFFRWRGCSHHPTLNHSSFKPSSFKQYRDSFAKRGNQWLGRESCLDRALMVFQVAALIYRMRNRPSSSRYFPGPKAQRIKGDSRTTYINHSKVGEEIELYLKIYWNIRRTIISPIWSYKSRGEELTLPSAKFQEYKQRNF
jgi:hypothetical protein